MFVSEFAYGHAQANTIIAKRTIKVVATRTKGFVIWGLICLIISVVGFWPSYIAPIATGTFTDIVPMMPWHVSSTAIWLVLVVLQSTLILKGRTNLHRLIGMIGAIVAVAVVVTGVVVQIGAMGVHAAQGDQANAVSVPFFRFVALILYAICIALAIAQRGRPDWHKRWMILGTIGLLEAPISRFFLHGFEVSASIAGPVAAISRVLLMIAFLIWDRRTHGRYHPVSLCGAVVITIVVFGTAPIIGTAWWHEIAAQLATTGSSGLK
jgi:hypothetical protein